MIFFDIDGTLIDHLSASSAASLALYDHFAGQIPFSREEFPSAWEAIMDRHFNRFTRGEISLWDQRRARIRESFGAPELSDAEADQRYFVFIREYEGLTRAYDDAASCLEKLAGQKLGIISNGASEQQLGKLRRAGILEYFSVTAFPEHTGFGKPHPSIFQEACRRAGEDPRGCIHVGDDLVNDIDASHRVGLHPVWIDRRRSAETRARSGVPTITSLTELVATLEDWMDSGVLKERELPQRSPGSREKMPQLRCP